MKVEMYPHAVRADDNPFITILADGLKEAGVQAVQYMPFRRGYLSDALHVHWLEQVAWGRFAKRLRGVMVVLARCLVRRAREYRAAGRPVVWTVHNLAPHESLKGEASQAFAELRRLFLPLVTDVIFMSGSIVDEVVAQYPEISGAVRHVIPLPHFRRFFADIQRPGVEIDPGAYRKAPVLAVIGMLRPYKGIPQLISVARELDEDFLMIVAGHGDPGICGAIEEAIGSDRRFVLDKRRLTHSDVVSALSGADLAVFNFQSILNSASVLTALSLDTPVLCPSSASLSEIAQLVGSDWVSCFDPPLRSEHIARSLRNLKIHDGKCPLDLHNPARVGEMHRAVYSGVSQ